MPGIWGKSAVKEVDRYLDFPDSLGYDEDWKPRHVAIELADPTLTAAQHDILVRLAQWRLPVPYLEEQCGDTMKH